jgi:hypothetical protein
MAPNRRVFPARTELVAAAHHLQAPVALVRPVNREASDAHVRKRPSDTRVA